VLDYRSNAGEPFWLAIVNRDASRRVASDTLIELAAVGPRPGPSGETLLVGAFLVLQGAALAVRAFRSTTSDA
jgi:hypothetical protein